ncbi:MAG: DUF1559 domain-containing protein [Thermoguttaceae bacterium]|nr:DUF1559 domain-containing protein [Thermoguttaceae bacterium]
MSLFLTSKKSIRQREGFTLVELLVVIAIIAVLVGLMVPAVQSARESARQTECKNNLKQMGLGFQSHHEANGNWPANGWGFHWAGDPNMGHSRRQPGGWMYNILPYTDYTNLWELGLNIGADYQDANRKAAVGELVRTPTKYMNCPSRRANKAFPNSANQPVDNATDQAVHARADYAVNAGNFSNCTTGASLPSCIGTVAAAYSNPTSLNWNALDRGNCSGYSSYSNSGISYFASQFSESDVTDGLSNTLCVGEKYLPINDYLDGSNGCDNNPAYVGFDWDNVRWGPAFQGQDRRPDDFTTDANLAPVVDSNSTNRGSTAYRMPTRDEKTFFQDSTPQFFGSAHSAFFQGVMCDGSVRTFPYNIDARVMGCYCNRMDGVAIESITVQ